VALSGPGSTHEGLADQLSGLIHLPVAVAEPLGGLDVNGALDGEDPHRHTVAAGLALGAAA
jgi:Tfp pilus assembly PilM family ATPase